MATKVVIAGAGGVGKSCCTLRYVKGIFQEEYDPTIEESYSKTVDVGGRKVPIELIDTAGQEEFESFRNASLQYGEGFVVVYSITEQKTWENALKLIELINYQRTDDATLPVIVLGNKCDLPDRQVDSSEVEQYCKENNFKFFETSAKSGHNINEAFEFIVKEIKTRQKSKPSGGANQGGGASEGGCCILM